MKECIICYDTRLHINLDCGHDVCTECYPNIQNKCPFRCLESMCHKSNFLNNYYDNYNGNNIIYLSSNYDIDSDFDI